MNITLKFQEKSFTADLSSPLDISLPATGVGDQGRAFYLPPTIEEPFRAGTFVGSVQEGGACNCFVMNIAPHGAGTHTETYGHIDEARPDINSTLKKFHFFARLVSVTPEQLSTGDLLISRTLLEEQLPGNEPVEALIIRTLPNSPEKRQRVYSGTNPAYFSDEAMEFVVERDIRHLLIDLPSVDKEDDGGLLAAHHIFWGNGSTTRRDCTITEMIFVDEQIPDGLYLLNVQIAPLKADASPSKPCLYALCQV